MVEPRIAHVPEADPTVGEDAVRWCAAHGLGLDDEQEFVLKSGLGTRPDGRFQPFEVGINTPRQNGKGEILMARELYGLYELGERLVIHSAHEFKTSERHFKRMEAAIKSSPELLRRVKKAPTGRTIGFRYSHGDEAIELENGASIEFKTRTKAGMRGFEKVSLLVLDEAMIISEAAHGSMFPTLRASDAPRGPQLWYAGSAADQEIQENAVVWSRVRERALAGSDPSLAYFEWSLPYDHPNAVPDDVADDPDNWRRVNFAIEHGRVSEEHMERERRSMGARAFVVELLGVGDWPRTDHVANTKIDIEVWLSLVDEQSVLTDPICLAFDVSPERKGSISAAGRRADGLWHVEVLEAGLSPTRTVHRVLELHSRHSPARITCDSFGPAGSIVDLITREGVKVDTVSAGEHAQACGRFVDVVDEREIRHLGSRELIDAIRGARTRPLTDAWAWSRKASTVDIAPLVSATLAISAAIDNERHSVYEERELVVL